MVLPLQPLGLDHHLLQRAWLGRVLRDKIWSANAPSHDYWNGVLDMLALLHVSGSFHLYP